MEFGQIALLLFALLLVVLNGFFVAAEFAFVKVRATRVEQLVREGGRSSARILRQIHAHLDGYLSAAQLGITLASLALGWVGEPALGALIQPVLGALGIESPQTVHAVSITIAFTLITFMHVVLGEQAPKSLGIMKAESVALFAAWPMRVFYSVTYPLIATLNGSANWFLARLGLPPASEHEHAHSPEELSMAVETSHEHGLLDAEQRALIDNALRLRSRHVREIMVPRPDMHCLYIDRPVKENLATLQRHHHTRYPLARRDADDVIGMVHVKDLVSFDSELDGEPVAQVRLRRLNRASLLELARPISFVPEVAPIDRALKTFQRGRSHMAVVVDEWGGVVGLVTLEDVLEELVGEIHDEFDVDDDGAEPEARQLEDGSWLVKGSWPLLSAAQTLGLKVGEAGVDTIGGLIMHELGRVPTIGDRVRIGRWCAEVVRMRRQRVTGVRLTMAQTAQQAAKASTSGEDEAGA